MNYCEYCGGGYVSKKCQMCDEVIYACDCDHLCNAHECVRCGALVPKLNEGDLCDDCQSIIMEPCEFCGDAIDALEIDPTDFHLIYSLGGAVKSEYKSFASPDAAEEWLKSIGAKFWTIEYWDDDDKFRVGGEG